jgi:hypothetical protein
MLTHLPKLPTYLNTYLLALSASTATQLHGFYPNFLPPFLV